MFHRCALGLCVVGLVFASVTAAQAVGYAFFDLGAAGDTTSLAYAINSSNIVAGRAQPGLSNGQAFVWSPATGRTMLPTLSGGSTALALAINNAGAVAGLSAASPANTGWIYNTNNTPANLSDDSAVGVGARVPGGINGGRLMAINSSGQVVGQATISGSTAGYYWDGVSANAQIIHSPVGNWVTPDAGMLNAGINDSGLVVGYYQWGPDADHHGDCAVIWHPGDANATNISVNINAAISGALGGRAMAVNNSGEIVGYYTTDFDFQGSPLLYKDSTHIVALPGLGSDGQQTGGNGQALAINDGGAAVGWALLPDGTTQHAFVWNPTVANGTTGTTTDLNSASLLNPSAKPAGFSMYDAYGINSHGSVVGYMWNGLLGLDCVYRAFALIPSVAGDANVDGKVDINDLSKVLTNYDKSADMSWTTGDFNGDGKVDINDLSIVLTNYDHTLAASGAGLSTVPEPGMLALLAAGLLGVAAYVWRKR